MKVGDLVTFAPQSWGTPLEDRPIGIVMNMESAGATDFDDGLVSVLFPEMDAPYSSIRFDFEVVNEDW